MPTLLFVIFAVELAAHLINAVGAAEINNLVRPTPVGPVPACPSSWAKY